MTTKVWLVDFSNGFHQNNVVAKTVAQAVRIATKLFKDETNEFVQDQQAEGKGPDSYTTWKTYMREGRTKPTNVELVVESDN